MCGGVSRVESGRTSLEVLARIETRQYGSSLSLFSCKIFFYLRAFAFDAPSTWSPLLLDLLMAVSFFPLTQLKCHFPREGSQTTPSSLAITVVSVCFMKCPNRDLGVCEPGNG